jgi:hypothetical protein
MNVMLSPYKKTAGIIREVWGKKRGGESFFADYFRLQKTDPDERYE